MDFLIVGGGIGGLTAALCLAEAGQDVQVLEQAAQISEVGAGLQISPNGMKVFRALDLDEAVRREGFEPEAIELRFGRSGQRIFKIPLGEQGEQRWCTPYVHIHRADLIALLLEAVTRHPKIDVSLNSKVDRINENEGSVEVFTQAGDTYSAACLIGADGVHSVVLEHLHGAVPARFTGNIAWRGVVPVEQLGTHAPPPCATAWVGPGKHAVTYRLRGGKLANFVGVVEQSEWVKESWSEAGDIKDLQADFQGWHPTIDALVRSRAEFFRWGLHDRSPLPFWSKRRVTLLGDAAHPMLPFVAQGAVMAIEDAWVLAKCLNEDMPVDRALKQYETLRLPRTSRVQAQSRQNAKTFHKQSPMTRLTTYGPMQLADRLAPQVVRSKLDWLYGFDPTSPPDL